MKQYIVIILLTVFGLNSCKKSGTTSSSTFTENLKIRMSESVDSTKRSLFLNCYTEKIFGCSNYGIQSTYVLTENKITINFIQIVVPNICLTSLSPAFLFGHWVHF